MGEVQERLCAVFPCPKSTLERLHLTIYEPDGHYKVHHDLSIRRYTFLVYLNDEFEGGATTFPCLGTTIVPKAGRLVAWINALSIEQPSQQMVHYAEPVTRGRKLV